MTYLHVHALSLGFGMAFLLEYPHGLYLIDAGSPQMESVVLRKMRQLNRSDLRLIWITHAHYDHYGSAAALRAATGASIAVHPLDAPFMAAGQSPLGASRRQGFLLRRAQPFFNRVWPLPSTPPDVQLQDQDNLLRYQLDALVLHTPGHTPGHTCLIVENRIAFAGDLVAWNGHAKKQDLLATDWNQIDSSVARLQAVHPEWVYTGHQKQPFPGEQLQSLLPT